MVLSAHIWYEKELWSLDYSSFVYSFKNFFQRENSGTFSNTDDLLYWSEFSPEFISFTYGSQKYVTYAASPDFVEANNRAEKVISTLKKEGNTVSVTDEEYLNAYKTNSMMLKFSSDISLQDFLKQDDAFFDVVKDPYSSTLVIGIDDSQSNYLTFKDSKTGHAYRMSVSHLADVNAIVKTIEAHDSTASFAFELNFDVKKDDTPRILFYRFVPITLNQTALRPLEVKPVKYSSDYDGIFKALGIVKNSARTYRDKENTIHFIENRSTLKIFDSGAFRFEATDRESGVKLSDGDERSRVTEFVNLLYRNILPESEAFFSLANVKKENSKTRYEFYYNTKNGMLYHKENPAVCVVVENGTIMEYEQMLYFISVKDGETFIPAVLEAYDWLYNQPDFEEKIGHTLNSMIPCHILTADGVKPGWICHFSDRSVSYYIP